MLIEVPEKVAKKIVVKRDGKKVEFDGAKIALAIQKGFGDIVGNEDSKTAKYNETDVNKVKVIVTIPIENVEEVRNAICEAGAGIIGNYTYCSMSTKCIGTFKPNDNANPYIGENNKLEFVEEEKLEVVCDVDNVKRVISKLREVHPYEEPAIDIIPLIDESFFE